MVSNREREIALGKVKIFSLENFLTDCNLVLILIL